MCETHFPKIVGEERNLYTKCLVLLLNSFLFKQQTKKKLRSSVSRVSNVRVRRGQSSFETENKSHYSSVEKAHACSVVAECFQNIFCVS